MYQYFQAMAMVEMSMTVKTTTHAQATALVVTILMLMLINTCSAAHIMDAMSSLVLVVWCGIRISTIATGLSDYVMIRDGFNYTC